MHPAGKDRGWGVASAEPGRKPGSGALRSHRAVFYGRPHDREPEEDGGGDPCYFHGEAVRRDQMGKGQTPVERQRRRSDPCTRDPGRLERPLGGPISGDTRRLYDTWMVLSPRSAAFIAPDADHGGTIYHFADGGQY